MSTEPNQDLRPIMALDPAHRGLEGPEMPDEAMDLVLQTLQPLVNRETLTPEEWQVASDALASIRTEAGTGEPDELLRRLAVSQDDNTRADALADLAAWLEVRRPPSSHQWSGAPTPSRSWLVEDWLPWGRLAMLTGIGGAGKSRLALQLAAGIASGGGDPDAWIACPPGLLPIGKELPAAGGAVVFATWEEDPVEMDRRLMEIHHDGDAPWVTPERISRLHLVDMAGDGPVWGLDFAACCNLAPLLAPFCVPFCISSRHPHSVCGECVGLNFGVVASWVVGALSVEMVERAWKELRLNQ